MWIKSQGSGKWAIGSWNSAGSCPLYWRGDRGNTKNAEFRCGSPISDVFWIKEGMKIVRRVNAEKPSLELDEPN